MARYLFIAALGFSGGFLAGYVDGLSTVEQYAPIAFGNMHP